MANNLTLPCESFDSLTTLILAVGASQVNVTAQIQVCPQLCSLAWGNGNPDFSGVGANFSWIVQASLTLLLGPLLLICIAFERSYPPRPGRQTIEDIHKDFFAASALVALPTTFASLIYLKKVTFLFEVTYLYYLNAMQFLSLFSTMLSGFMSLDEWDDIFDAYDPKQEDGVSKHFKRNIKAGLCWFFAMAFFIGVTVFINKSRLSFPFLPQLTAACGDYGDIIPKIPKQIDTPPVNLEWLAKITQWFVGNPGDPIPDGFFPWLKANFFMLVYCALATAASAILGISIYLFVTKVVGGCLECLQNSGFLEKPSLVFATLSLGVSIGMIYCVAQMQFDRNKMKEVLGEDYVDKQWGFGQIISLFLWAQIIWVVSKWTFSLAKRAGLHKSLWRLFQNKNIAKEIEESSYAEEGRTSEDHSSLSEPYNPCLKIQKEEA